MKINFKQFLIVFLLTYNYLTFIKVLKKCEFKFAKGFSNLVLVLGFTDSDIYNIISIVIKILTTWELWILLDRIKLLKKINGIENA